jgi:hypothetical protein
MCDACRNGGEIQDAFAADEATGTRLSVEFSYRKRARTAVNTGVPETHPLCLRGSSLGDYRFWRDRGYGIGALLLGLIAEAISTQEAGFWFTSVAMALSGL